MIVIHQAHLRTLDDLELAATIERLRRLAEAINPGASTAAAILHHSYADALDAARAEMQRRASV